MARGKLEFSAANYRQALRELSATSAWESLQAPKRREIYVPAAHGKALSPEYSIVEGMRGAGKSFWTAVLLNDETRHFVAASTRLAENLIVRVGFGLDLSDEHFPSRRRIDDLLARSHTPDALWRAVLLRHAVLAVQNPLPCPDDWDALVTWSEQQPAASDRILAECDRRLAEQGKVLLLLFDSLDRLAEDWSRIRQRLSAALKLCLECRTRRALRCKFFLRPDMVEDKDEIWRFADSSKLLHARAALDWRRDDLYSVILLQLANSPVVGDSFRDLLAATTGARWQAIDGAYPLPERWSATVYQEVIEALAGPWVGRSVRKGYTYSWIPTHLSDAQGRLSPRSILLAFKEAAEWTAMNAPECPTALHFQGIQQGVVKASETRINEISEDYPWIEPLLSALRGIAVPLTFDDLRERWTAACVSESLAAAADRQRLPPRHYSAAPERPLNRLVDDLVELAVLYRTTDDRYNMPDIFRVGFGIKRKGGVRPPR